MSELVSQHRFNTFADTGALDSTLADHVAKILSRDIESRGAATLAVSGGSTPFGFFQTLSRATLNWQLVTITLVDERWVPPQHADSNEKLVRDHLLKNNAASATLIGLWTGDDTPQAGLHQCEQTLAELQWPLSVVVLGMGADGHSASWFPNGDNLAEQLSLNNKSLCATGQGAQPRITLTLAAALNCHSLVLHFTGSEKREVYERAFDELPVILPISAVLGQEKKPVDVYWCP